LIEKYSIQVSCQINAESGAIDQLRLGDRPVDCYRPVGPTCFASWEGNCDGYKVIIYWLIIQDLRRRATLSL